MGRSIRILAPVNLGGRRGKSKAETAQDREDRRQRERLKFQAQVTQRGERERAAERAQAVSEGAKARSSGLARTVLGGALAANRNPNIGKVAGELGQAFGGGGGTSAGAGTGIGANALALNERIRAARKKRAATGAEFNRRKNIEDAKRITENIRRGVNVPSFGDKFGNRLPSQSFTPGNFKDSQGNIISFPGRVSTPRQQELVGEFKQRQDRERRKANLSIVERRVSGLRSLREGTQNALDRLQGERQQAIGEIPGGQAITQGPQGVQNALGPTVQGIADTNRQFSGPGGGAATTGFTAGEAALQNRIASLEAQLAPELARMQQLFQPLPPFDPRRLPVVVPPPQGGATPGAGIDAPPAQPGASEGGPINLAPTVTAGANGVTFGGQAFPDSGGESLQDRFARGVNQAGGGQPLLASQGPQAQPPPRSAPFGIGSRLDQTGQLQREPQGGPLVAGQQTFGRPGEQFGTVASHALGTAIPSEVLSRFQPQPQISEQQFRQQSFAPTPAQPPPSVRNQVGPVAPPQQPGIAARIPTPIQQVPQAQPGTPAQPQIPAGARPGDVGNLNFQGGAFGGGFSRQGQTQPPAQPAQAQPAQPAAQTPLQQFLSARSPLDPDAASIRSLQAGAARSQAALDRTAARRPTAGQAPAGARQGAAPSGGSFGDREETSSERIARFESETNRMRVVAEIKAIEDQLGGSDAVVKKSAAAVARFSEIPTGIQSRIETAWDEVDEPALFGTDEEETKKLADTLESEVGKLSPEQKLAIKTFFAGGEGKKFADKISAEIADVANQWFTIGGDPAKHAKEWRRIFTLVTTGGLTPQEAAALAGSSKPAAR